LRSAQLGQNSSEMVGHLNFPRASMLAACVGIGATTFLLPSATEACGGTFPEEEQETTVNLDAINVLFRLTNNSVETHIQMAYDASTDASGFALVLPVPALPQFTVGSAPLFDRVLEDTAPRFDIDNEYEDCGTLGGGSMPSAGGDTAASGAEDTAGNTAGGPEVLLEETVGAFDVAVLSGGTVDELLNWLTTEGYATNPSATPILQQYLDEEFMFAAMKLSNSADAHEIHPLVLRYENPEACVPIRMTSISALEDLNLRAFFFNDDAQGSQRVVPTNYRHVTINPLKIDWFDLADSYKEAVRLAVDAPGADGNAFVTEFAGQPELGTYGIFDIRWDAAVFASMTDPVAAMSSTLETQGLAYCEPYGGGCTWGHPLIRGLLLQYLPVPDGIGEGDFYNCVSCYADEVDLGSWDPAAFAADFENRIVEPGAAARDLVEQNRYVTRLFTRISPEEMNEDPIFAVNPDLPGVTNNHSATRTQHCDGTSTVVLPDGRRVRVPSPGAWPDIAPDKMPWEQEIQRGTLTGALLTDVDRNAEIDALLKQWNDSVGPANPAPKGCSCRTKSEEPGAMLMLAALFAGRRRRRR
jgi:MYXO-CTERM domain-containing protein